MPRISPVFHLTWVLPTVLGAGVAIGLLLPQQDSSNEGNDIPKVVVAHAIVDTAESGCDTQKLGNCWLPLYPRPLMAGTPYNLRESPDSPCRKDSEVDCWPQPGTTVTLTCQHVAGDGQVWYGVSVPRERILTDEERPRPKATPEVTGFALSRWLRPTEQLAGLRACFN